MEAPCRPQRLRGLGRRRLPAQTGTQKQGERGNPTHHPEACPRSKVTGNRSSHRAHRFFVSRVRSSGEREDSTRPPIACQRQRASPCPPAWSRRRRALRKTTRPDLWRRPVNALLDRSRLIVLSRKKALRRGRVGAAPANPAGRAPTLGRHGVSTFRCLRVCPKAHARLLREVTTVNVSRDSFLERGHTR